MCIYLQHCVLILVSSVAIDLYSSIFLYSYGRYRWMMILHFIGIVLFIFKKRLNYGCDDWWIYLINHFLEKVKTTQPEKLEKVKKSKIDFHLRKTKILHIREKIRTTYNEYINDHLFLYLQHGSLRMFPFMFSNYYRTQHFKETNTKLSHF